MSREKVFYVSNKELFAAYMAWYAKIAEAKEAGLEEPPLPNYIAECMMKICRRLSYRPNFANYSYRDEMISDAIENCVKKAQKFNPEKSDNPFSYITTIAYHTFVNRITTEKKQAAIKGRLISEIDLNDIMDCQDHDSGEHNIHAQFVDYLKENSYLVNANVVAQPKRVSVKESDEFNLTEFEV
jgi:DNA-directed RNA polymerase specialized sigma24 family protein